MNKVQKFINEANKVEGSWKVFINGKDSGIVETDYQWASTYWEGQALRTGKKYRLVKAEDASKQNDDFDMKRWDRLHGR